MVDLIDERGGGSGGLPGGRVLTLVVGIVTVAIMLAALVWWWRLTPEQQTAYWEATKATALWFVFMLILPWGLFFVPPIVTKQDSNVASALMLVGYQAIDLVMLLWLWNWTVGGAGGAVLLLIGMALAAAYNYVVCESISRYVG